MVDVFAFTDYRELLRAEIEANRAVRGYQSRLATAAGCKRSFLSQCLHSEVNLTLDHGAGLCHYWKLGDDEADWFMELLNLARAGTPQLRKLCQRRMATLRQKRNNLVERLKPAHVLPESAQARYYSSWYWAAIHIVTCLPHCDTPAKIALRLGLHETRVAQTLAALEEMGLVQRQNGQRWKVKQFDMHVPKKSSLNLIHHVQWRQRAIADIQLDHDDTLHYTAIHALSHRDLDRVQEQLTTAIESIREIVKPSPEEDVVCLGVDLFRV